MLLSKVFKKTTTKKNVCDIFILLMRNVKMHSTTCESALWIVYWADSPVVLLENCEWFV